MPRILDAKGRELSVGDRVLWQGGDLIVVTVGAPFEGIVRVGLYHGAAEEYQPHFCTPGVVAEQTIGGDFACPDLELLEPPKREAATAAHERSAVD